MKHKISQSLYTYWNEIRGQRVAPRRFEIEPARIAGILPDTFILECGETGQARFRLAGTRMSNLLGRDVRDCGFVDLFQAEDHKALGHILEQTTEQAAVCVITAGPVTDLSPRKHAEILLLPLFHTQNAVSRILGCAVPLTQDTATARSTAVPQRMIAHEIIWPEGRPHVILKQMNRQSPFAAEHRGARIVTADRRRFRVFDGGKTP